MCYSIVLAGYRGKRRACWPGKKSAYMYITIAEAKKVIIFRHRESNPGLVGTT
jgi:hypothetical protein